MPCEIPPVQRCNCVRNRELSFARRADWLLLRITEALIRAVFLQFDTQLDVGSRMIADSANKKVGVRFLPPFHGLHR